MRNNHQRQTLPNKVTHNRSKENTHNRSIGPRCTVVLDMCTTLDLFSGERPFKRQKCNGPFHYVLGPRAKNWHLTGWFHKDAEDPRQLFDAKTMRFMQGQHENSDSQKHHWQVFVQYLTKVRSTAVRRVFPPGKWRNSPMDTNVRASIKYCSKDRTFVSDRFTLGELPTEKGKASSLAKAVHSLQVDGKGLTWLAKNNPMASIMFGSRIATWLPRMRAVPTASEFKLDDYKWDPAEAWSKTHIFWGISGIGKTEFALAHFKNPLIVSHPDKLKEHDPSFHDGILFDDVDFLHWPHNSCIHLADNKLPRDINVKCSMVTIPAGTRKIFTTNNDLGIIFKDQHLWALQRRIQVHHLEGPQFDGPPEEPPPKRRKHAPLQPHIPNEIRCDCIICLK